MNNSIPSKHLPVKSTIGTLEEGMKYVQNLQ